MVELLDFGVSMLSKCLLESESSAIKAGDKLMCLCVEHWIIFFCGLPEAIKMIHSLLF